MINGFKRALKKVIAGSSVEMRNKGRLRYTIAGIITVVKFQKDRNATLEVLRPFLQETSQIHRMYSTMVDFGRAIVNI